MDVRGNELRDTDPRLARLHRIDWGPVLAKLVLKARRWGASAVMAEDLANDAFEAVLRDGAATWDPETDPTAYVCLLKVVSDKLRYARKKERRRQKKLPTDLDSDAVDEAEPESVRGAERGLLEREAAVRNGERLREGLAGHPLSLAVVELHAREGMMDPQEIAERLGVAVKEVYRAEEQIRRHVRRLREDGSDPAIRVVRA